MDIQYTDYSIHNKAKNSRSSTKRSRSNEEMFVHHKCPYLLPIYAVRCRDEQVTKLLCALTNVNVICFFYSLSSLFFVASYLGCVIDTEMINIVSLISNK